MTTVCRLCLKPAIDNVSFHYTDNSGFSTTSLVKALVPELYLGLSPNPVVCKSCYFHLRQAYVFRLRCLRSENLIGIYIRETKNTESLVLLDDVVNFWKKRYENKSEGLQCNLEEWFGKGRDKAEAPIILNQIASIVGSGNGNINKDVSAEDKQQEDDTFDLQKEISKESKETNSEKEKTAECIGDCSKPKDGISCKFTEFTGEREKRHDKKDYNNDIIVIDDIAKEFDDFINKACMESPEETIKIVMEPDCQTPKVKFNTSPKLVKILTKIKRPKSDKAPDVIESPKDKSKTIKIVVDEESHSSNEQYTAVLKLASKIPTKQCKTTTPMKKNVIEPGEDTDRSINLICDMNDMDINSIVNELRKDENLEKLGFSNSEDDESYFIDKVDNKLSFALLPKHPDNDARKEADIDGGEKTTSLINRNKMDMSNRPPQKKVRNDSVSMGFSGNGKQSEFINDVTGAKEPVKGTSIGGCLDTRLNEGQKDEDKRKKALNENVTEVNLNRKSLERLPILLNDRIESEKDMFPPESEKPPLHPEPVSSTSQDKSPAIPMPIIRVRPASALQKVRTLNHELWPQNEMNNYAEDSFQLLYPMSSPQVPHGLPAKMGDGDTRPSPIVLNSQLDLSGGMASTLKPPPPPKPPSKLKEKRPVLKTYQRKIADGSKVLRRVNPLTYKALEEMQKMGLIKVVGVAEESQINKPIQQSLSYMVKRGVNLVNLDNFLENSGFELENPEGDLGNSGDLRVNSGEHSWDSGDLRGNSEDRRGNSGDLRENSGERSWDSGDLRGNSGDLRENSEERSWDSGGRRGNSGDIRGSSGDLRENSGDLRANSGDLGGISGASLGNVMDRRGSRDERNEYAIDIKEEPLNCTESDVLMNFGEVDQAAESEGETTRSASETSFMDTLHSQNDLVKTIVENIPDMGEEQYDEPEYVHINNVSFSDLTKMMGESKKHREIVNSKQMQPPQMNKKMTASERRKCYKYCFVPGCKVNSKRNKEKTFFKVPKREEVQKIWLAAVGRKFLRFKSPIYFCEDHFDEEDISLRSSNLKQFGSLPIKQLKIGALPHTCLTKRKPGIVNTDQISKLKQLQSEVKTTETSHKPKAIIIEKHRPDDTIIEEPCTSIAESKLRKANEEEYDFKKTPQPYKYDRRSCFVPGCSTNSRQHPNKIYVLVPTEESEQKVWFKTFKRPFYCNPFRNIKYYCCEDHFTIIPGWESVVRDHKFGGLVPRSCVQLTIALKNEEEYDPKKTPQSHKYGLRSCFVPGCSTNSRQHPNKIYALVPRKESEQKVWFETFKRPFSYYQNIKYYCCEDHFTIIPGMESVARDNKFGGLVPRSCVQLKIALKPNQPEHTPSSTKEVQKRSIGWWCKYLRVSDNVKSCVVPNCNNSMKECPDKVFIRIPAVDKVQKRWYAALGRDCNQPVKDEPDLCCEDHFSPKQLDMFKSFGPSMLLREFFLPRKITTKKPPKPIKRRTKYSQLTHKLVVLYVPKINPMRLKTRITDLMRNELKRTNQSTQAPRPQITKIRAGKRLRLVQVDADGKEIEEVVPRMRRRLEPQSVLKSNVDRRSVRRIGSFNDGNVCVLYTNFTSEGDYINDHDYLVNPYVRNKMFFHHGLASVCICLLCDLKHRSIDHIDHMKSHKTICQVCRVDFHNVFILNLHVKSHSTYCSECERAVTYANHMAHAAEHNKSLTLSNIDVPDDVVPDYLQKGFHRFIPGPPTWRGWKIKSLSRSLSKILNQHKSAEGTSQTRKEKQPPSSRKSFPTLAELLREQPLDTNSRLRTSSSSPSVSPRRSRRITRSKKYEEDYIDNEEEACIYDKTTRSFITPSAEKQQKLLEKCYSDNQTTDTSKKVETHLSPDSSIENLKKGDCETQETDITLSSLLCDETIHKTDSETSLIKTDNVSIKQENIIKIEPKKTKKPTKKRRQKRLMMPKKKSKFFPHKTLKPNESQESKNTKSVKLTTPEPNNMDSVNLTNDESSSKPDLSLTKSDLVAVDDVKTVENNEKSSDSGNTEKLSNDSTNTENDTCKSQEVAKSNISESKVTRRSKKSVGMLRKDLVEVKTYSRSSKRKGGGSNADTSISTSPAEKGGEPTAVFTPPSEITDMIDGTEKKTNKNVESPTTNSLTKQKETRASKAGCRKNEPSKSIVKSKMATLKSGKVNKKLLNATLPKSSITTDTLSYVPLDTTIEKDNTKTPVDSTNESRKSTKVFLDGTEASKDTTELCRDSTKIPKKSTKSSKNSEGKSPLRGDLKMKIKSLNYSPFVSLTDVFTEVPNLKEKLSKPMSETKPKVLKVYERTGRTKKVPDDNLETSPALVDNKLEVPVVDVKVEERLSLSLAVSDEKNTGKHTNENIDETLKEKDDKNLKSDKLMSNSKARSSRSRGSLGLVEGLKGNEKRGSRKPKKSSTSLQDDSSGNLDTSQPLNEDLQIKLEETTDEAPISCLETVQLKNTAFDEPLVLKNIEADVNNAETSNKSSEASTSDSKELELENNKWLRESSLIEEDKRLN